MISSSLHGKVLLFSLAVMGLTALAFRAANGGNAARTIAIAVEHASPASITLTVASHKGGSIIELHHPGSETIHVSLPQNWDRTEVRGVPLKSVTREDPALGFVRWTLPGGATMALQSPQIFDAVTIHNPSNIPLTVKTITVDIALGRSEQDAVIVGDAPATIRLDSSD